MAINHSDLERALHELIAALDRRVPRVERAGEASIGREAAALRERAVKRLAELAEQKTSEAGVMPESRCVDFGAPRSTSG